jgi:hypothetical protein
VAAGRKKGLSHLSISNNICKSNNDYLPDPLQTLEGFKKSRNIDIPELDPLELTREELRAKQLLATFDLEAILFIDSRGNPVTIRDWLLRRLAAIRKEKQRRGGHLRRVE